MLPSNELIASPCAGRLEDWPDIAVDFPDWHGVIRQDDTIVSRCSLWWRRVPAYEHHHVGMFGHFFASNDRAADALLKLATEQLRRNGCSLAIGPMDGDTWGRYRWVTDSGNELPFFLEPTNPPAYPEHVRRHGFEPIAHYFSALTMTSAHDGARLIRARNRLSSQGVRIRSISDATFDQDLAAILQLARLVFRNNPFYLDPDEAAFFLQCQQLQQVVPLDFIQLAFHHGQLVGFVFAIPDLCQRKRNEVVNTLIVKTLAALNNRQYAGLGQVLLARVQRDAFAAGYHRTVHALVRDVPHLRRISERSARPIRRYSLFAKALSS